MVPGGGQIEPLPCYDCWQARMAGGRRRTQGGWSCARARRCWQRAAAGLCQRWASPTSSQAVACMHAIILIVHTMRQGSPSHKLGGHLSGGNQQLVQACICLTCRKTAAWEGGSDSSLMLRSSRG